MTCVCSERACAQQQSCHCRFHRYVPCVIVQLESQLTQRKLCVCLDERCSKSQHRFLCHHSCYSKHNSKYKQNVFTACDTWPLRDGSTSIPKTGCLAYGFQSSTSSCCWLSQFHPDWYIVMFFCLFNSLLYVLVRV